MLVMHGRAVFTIRGVFGDVRTSLRPGIFACALASTMSRASRIDLGPWARLRRPALKKRLVEAALQRGLRGAERAPIIDFLICGAGRGAVRTSEPALIAVLLGGRPLCRLKAAASPPLGSRSGRSWWPKCGGGGIEWRWLKGIEKIQTCAARFSQSDHANAASAVPSLCVTAERGCGTDP